MKHCESFISRESFPNCLRWWLLYNTLPAVDKHLFKQYAKEPILWAKYNGEWVKLLMASRLGDVGITNNLDATHGYTDRVHIEELLDFTDERPKK